MKKNNAYKATNSRTPFRSSANAAKTRDSEGGKSNSASYKGVKAKSDFRSSEQPRRDDKPRRGAKPAFGEKPSFGEKTFRGARAKPDFRSSETNRGDEKPRRGAKPAFGEKPSFGEKTYRGARAKPDFRSGETNRGDEKPRRSAKPAFGEKSSFGEKTYRGARAKPDFRSSEPSRRDEKPRRGAKPAFGEKSSFGEKVWFGDKTKSRAKTGDKPRFADKAKSVSKFAEKPRFAEKATFEARPKPAFRAGGKPAFHKAVSEAREESFTLTENCVLIWGLHAARAAFLNPKRRITRLWLTEAGQKIFEASQIEAKEELLKRPDAKRADRDALDRMTPPGSVHQGIVIEVAPLPEISLHDVISANPPPDIILMLDQVTDPHNVGAILRSAAAFGAGAVIMTERNAPTTTGVLAKTASGALEHTPMIHVVNLARALDELREAGYWCVGLAEEGEKNLGDLDMSGRTVLVLGAEGEGLRHLTRQKCDELARLPTQGPVGSLNVSNAAAVALYEVRKQVK